MTTQDRAVGDVATAQKLATPRNINGVPFDGSQDITVSGGGGGDALVANPLSQFAATTSAQLRGVLSDETGTGVAVFATSPTLVTPALGTPASGDLANCTGLPVAGLASSTSTAVGVGTVELGHASDTTLSRISAGVLAVEGSALAFAVAAINPQTGTTYTLALTDVNNVITASNASAQTYAFPQNSDVAIPVGAAGEIHVIGAGQVTCAAGTGATVDARGGALKSNGQYAVLGWRKVSTNGFVIFGDTTT